MKLHDCIVVGGGPAGSTVGSLLAKDGHDVLVLEADVFPRFHIGESLLPSELPIFEKLGFEMSGMSSVFKEGADFLDERSGKCARFAFAEGLEGTRPHSYQVERAVFDEALLNHCAGLGAQVQQDTKVVDIDIQKDFVCVRTADADHRARYVVDATGRDRVLSKQHKSYERLQGLGLAAVWAHFDGMPAKPREELEKTGNIIVLMLESGWGWVIPLNGGRVSIGFVSAEKGVVSHDWFEEVFAASPFLQRITKGAPRSPLQMVGDYSYKNTSPHGPRWACVGDANGFLDPVFSSGVALAMAGAEKLAELLSPALAEKREDDAALMAPMQAHMDHAYGVFNAVLQSFYHTNLVDNLFFYDDPDMNLRAGLISILAGDVWRDDNDFQKMILRRNEKRLRRARKLVPA
ncbi:MAG: NAD(P)/FAD-dependent oxidoreductase [Polyangiales bacterium]